MSKKRNYISATALGIKQHQDMAFSDTSMNNLLLCDGIGSYENSGKVAKGIIDTFFEKHYSDTASIRQFVKKTVENIMKEEITGGTTFIHAQVDDKNESIDIHYLGNGGIIHLYGDFAHNPSSGVAYRYMHLMQPHVNSRGELTKHISHNSTAESIEFTVLKSTLNYNRGDILLLFTDGITSLEENVIIQDGQGRYWRNEAESLHEILLALDTFLLRQGRSDNFQKELSDFNRDILQQLKAKELLEDDASLGIVLTDKVLQFYKNKPASSD